MLRAERTLAEIRVRLKFAGDAELAAHSHLDVRRLVGAVDGVLTLHRPRDGGRCRVCQARPIRRWHPAPRAFRGWPCVTVRTVIRALDHR